MKFRFCHHKNPNKKGDREVLPDKKFLEFQKRQRTQRDVQIGSFDGVFFKSLFSTIYTLKMSGL